VFRGYEGKVELNYLAGLPLNDLLREVAGLPDRSIIYYLHIFEDGLGNTFVPAEVLGPLSSAANAPIYGHFDTYVGRGIVGGRVVSFEAEGANAARVTARILAGERPERIAPPGTIANPSLFDWRELRRWGIEEGRLPPGSIVLNRPPGFWDLYRWRVIGAVVLCIAEAFLIVILLVERANRRRAEARFRQAVAAAPSGMIMVGPSGRMVLVNPEAEASFGYTAEEMLRQPLEMLVPPRFSDRHPALRGRFFDAPASRPMGAGRELFGRRKDGTEFPVEIALNPIQTGEGLFVLASIIDITERKRAEAVLQESQRELRALTGRLLWAQETERRRIARELHDDLNQSLALIAVELDLLAQNPPGPGAPPDGRLQELSGRVKELSSAVHDLSHQLHPTKLEQLGLVAAVRGLCNELGQAHGLVIEFAAEGVPTSIPSDAALCLYRVAQEALRNVIKHSGARHVRVELRGSPDAVHLRVADDGSGFDPGPAAGKGGLGLVSMRERLHLVGGEITVESKPSGGARVEVRIPRRTSPAGPAEGASHRQPTGVPSSG
jgi:PAS domain S-box-containing protein